MYKSFVSVIFLTAAVSFGAQAKDVAVKITQDKSYSTVHVDGELIKISRIQDTSHVIDGSYAKTSRPCPPFCINPLHVDDNVETVAELEVIKFIETVMYRGDGVMIDARTSSWYKKGTIPGSVNIPFTEFEKDADDPQLAEILESFGAVERSDVNPVLRMVENVGLLGGDEKTDKWDFTDAKELLLWCNGPWCGQSPRAIRGLLKVGYPAEKLHYYRGGMQMWQSLGLTTIKPKSTSVAKTEVNK
ncbi:MAG: rhodanese-like domain-containing protein [Gammaproteobacteria bacterium]|jgi:rhodanese-related sulfurtransferase|nr:rhodanese-like domain-containing protein [Gammaproteobacteria bacterium]